jgi:hypothetical protein
MSEVNAAMFTSRLNLLNGNKARMAWSYWGSKGQTSGAPLVPTAAELLGSDRALPNGNHLPLMYRFKGIHNGDSKLTGFLFFARPYNQ